MNSPILPYPNVVLAPPAPPAARAIAATLDRVAYAALCAFVFVLCWEDSVPLFGGFVISRWLGLLAFAVALLRVGVLPQTRPFKELHYWLLAFAAWSSASIFWTVDWDTTAGRVGTYAQLLVVAWLIWLVTTNDSRVCGLLLSYVLGTYIVAIGTIQNLLAGRTFSQMDDLDAARSARYTMEGINPNDLGLMLALSIPMAFYLMSRRRNNPLIVVFCWVQFGLCITAILLSGSRGSMLAGSAALLMFPLTVAGLPRIQKLMAALVGAGAVLAAIFLVPADTWQRFFNLSTEITEGTMTHRTQIWAASLQLFRDHAFLGVGSGAHPVAVVGILGRALVAHNTFVSVLVELGVMGGLIFFGLLAAAFYCAWQMRGLERRLWLLTLLTWCIGVCGGTWEYRKTTWFLLGLLIAHAALPRETASRETMWRDVRRGEY